MRLHAFVTALVPSRLRVLAVAAALLVLLAAPLSPVSVSPMAVYIDHRSRTGALTLYNPGTRSEEIEIGFGFGYPMSDEEGNISVPITDEAPDGEPSAVGWLTAFPRRLVLEPGQRQVVRIMARPPAELTEGEYWARALIRSRGGQAPIESRTGDVGIQLDIETVVVVAINYRNGVMRTGVEIESARAGLAADSVVAYLDVARTGNAAFLGRVLVEALDERGRVVAVAEDVLAVYRSMTRRLAVPIPVGAATPITVRYTLDTDREDLPPGGPLPVEPVVYEIPIR